MQFPALQMVHKRLKAKGQKLKVVGKGRGNACNEVANVCMDLSKSGKQNKFKNEKRQIRTDKTDYPKRALLFLKRIFFKV